jgi:ABC-type nitrate/sulfonate/bicarbonate transport system ATPase subunit
MAIFGKGGVGKSTLLRNMIAWDVEHGAGCNRHARPVGVTAQGRFQVLGHRRQGPHQRVSGSRCQGPEEQVSGVGLPVPG